MKESNKVNKDSRSMRGSKLDNIILSIVAMQLSQSKALSLY